MCISSIILRQKHERKTIKYNSMEGRIEKSYNLVEEAFQSHHSHLLAYVCYRIGDADDAEDLVQDVFVRLLECGKLLCKDTIKSFVFTIANNLITDYLRRYYKKQEICSYMMESAADVERSPESAIIAKDLEKHEKAIMRMLPPQRERIYYMNRFMDMSAEDISKELCLSKRTVGNHLLTGRKKVREYIKLCI